MVIRVDLSDALSRLSAYLERASKGRDRILISRSGQPLAALVSVEDLERLEGGEARPASVDEDKRARFRKSMEKAGLVLRWPAGDPLPKDAYRPLRASGAPLSADIIADRR